MTLGNIGPALAQGMEHKVGGKVVPAAQIEAVQAKCDELRVAASATTDTSAGACRHHLQARVVAKINVQHGQTLALQRLQCCRSIVSDSRDFHTRANRQLLEHRVGSSTISSPLPLRSMPCQSR